MTKKFDITDELVIGLIYTIRGTRVILDRDLAKMYGVETKVLNQAVARNIKRFPSDFMFKMTSKELANWKSQFVTSNLHKMGLRKRPNVFTEQGVAMLSSVLKSETAIDVNIQIIRIFTRIRELLSTHKDLLLKLELLENKVLQQNEKTNKHEAEIQIIFTALKRLLHTPPLPRKKIGYKSE
jgi:hypothetical protein